MADWKEKAATMVVISRLALIIIAIIIGGYIDSKIGSIQIRNGTFGWFDYTMWSIFVLWAPTLLIRPIFRRKYGN